jgi:hypothetical protein
LPELVLAQLALAGFVRSLFSSLGVLAKSTKGHQLNWWFQKNRKIALAQLLPIPFSGLNRPYPSREATDQDNRRSQNNKQIVLLIGVVKTHHNKEQTQIAKKYPAVSHGERLTAGKIKEISPQKLEGDYLCGD